MLSTQTGGGMDKQTDTLPSEQTNNQTQTDKTEHTHTQIGIQPDSSPNTENIKNCGRITLEVIKNAICFSTSLISRGSAATCLRWGG